MTHKILRITCKDTAWLAAIQRKTDLSLMLSLNDEYGILFLMNFIMNYGTLHLIPAVYSMDISKF